MCNQKWNVCNMKYSWQHIERAMQRLMTRLMVFLPGGLHWASLALHPPQTYNLLNCIADALLSSQWPYGRYNTVVWFGHTSQVQYTMCYTMYYTWQYATLGGSTRSPLHPPKTFNHLARRTCRKREQYTVIKGGVHYKQWKIAPAKTQDHLGTLCPSSDEPATLFCTCTGNIIWLSVSKMRMES